VSFLCDTTDATALVWHSARFEQWDFGIVLQRDALVYAAMSAGHVGR
jgi:hypothetical protein